MHKTHSKTPTHLLHHLLHKITHMSCALAVAIACFGPATASAQGGRQSIDWESTIKANGLLTTSVSTLAIYFTVQPIMSSTSSTSDLFFGTLDMARSFISTNSVAIAQDITMGAGDSIEDLAQLAGIKREHIPALAKLMHRERKKLIAILTEGPLTDQDVVHFSNIITEAMRHDPVLKTHRPKHT